MKHSFEVLYLLQKDSFYKKIYYASRALTFSITAQTVLSASFNWNNQGILWLVKLLYILSLPVDWMTKIQYYILLTAIVSLLLVTAGLFFKVRHAIIHGTTQNLRALRMLRTLLGLVETLANPILQVFLASANCDWIGHTQMSQVWDITESCSNDTVRQVAMGVSALAMIPFVFCLLMSSTMHVNDPKSSMILSRAHSRVDILAVVADFLSNSLFVFLSGYTGFLAALFLVLQLTVLSSFIVFQPYYHSFTNDLFSLFAGETAWVGLSFCVLLGTQSLDPSGKIATIFFYVGVLPFGVLCFWMSAEWRRRITAKTRLANDPDPTVIVEVLPDEEVFPVLRELYDPYSTTFFVTDLKATLIELRARFILKDKTPRSVDVAENILKRGLLDYPQSIYLRMQYVVFLVSYRKESMDVASVRLDETSALRVDFDMQFSLLRKRREIERKRYVEQMGSNAALEMMDSISYEEMKKRIKDASDAHRKILEITEVTWAALGRKLNGGTRKRKPKRPLKWNQVHALNLQSVGLSSPSAAAAMHGAVGPQVTQDEVILSLEPMFEELQRWIKIADSEYATLRRQCPDSKEVAQNYARYLRSIKKDVVAAEEVESKFSVQETSSSGSTQTSGEDAGQRARRHASMAATLLESISKLRLRSFATTFLLITALCASFVGLVTMSDRCYNAFSSINESGFRRSGSLSALYQLRQIHMAALRNDAADFLRLTKSLNDSILSISGIHYDLMQTYRSDYAPRNDYVASQTLSVRLAGADPGTVTTALLSPDVLLMQTLNSAGVALSQPMSKFLEVTPGDFSSFPELFFVYENAIEASRAMDTATGMFRAEIYGYTSLLKYLSLMLCVLAFVVEVYMVVVVFRPVVNLMFDDIRGRLARFREIPVIIVAGMEQAETVAVSRLKIMLGEERDESVSEKADGLETLPFARRVSPRKSSVPSGKFSSRVPRDHTKRNHSPTRARPVAVAIPEPAQLFSMQLDSEGNHDSEETLVVNTDDADSHPKVSADSPLLVQEGNWLPSPVSPHLNLPDASVISRKHTTPKSDDSIVIMSTEASVPATPERVPSAKWNPFLSSTAEHDPEGPDSDGDFPRPFVTIDEIRKAASDAQSNDWFELSPRDSDVTAQKVPDSFSPRLRFALPKVTPKSKSKRGHGGVSVAACSNVVIISDEQAADSGDTDHPSVENAKDSGNASRRKMRIIVTMWTLFVIFMGCLIITITFAFLQAQELNSRAHVVNNFSRRRSLFTMALMWGREIELSLNATTSLTGGILTMFNDIETLRGLLRASTSMGLSVHYAILYGREQGFDILPAARGFEPTDSLIRSRYSPLTRNIDLFYETTDIVGVVSDPPSARFLFVGQCLTTPDFAPSSFAMTDARMLRFSSRISEDYCPMYKQGNPIATNGLHFLYDSIFGMMHRMSNSSLDTKQSRQLYLENLDIALQLQERNSDLFAGMMKGILMAQDHTLETLQTIRNISTAVLAVVLCVISMQFLMLRWRVEVLLRGNLEMTMTMERMLDGAAASMVKRGYSRREILAVSSAVAEQMTPEEADDETSDDEGDQDMIVEVKGSDAV